jgi:hypothetical protein
MDSMMKLKTNQNLTKKPTEIRNKNNEDQS